MKKILLWMLFITLQIGSNCFAAAINSPAQEQHEWWTERKCGISLSYPDYFSSLDSDPTVTPYVYILKDESTGANISVSVGIYTDAEKNFKETKEELEKKYSTKIATENVKFGGLNGKSLTFSFKEENIDLSIYFVSLYKAGGKSYHLVFTATSETYSKYLNDVKQIFESFNILPYKKPAQTKEWVDLEYVDVKFSVPDYFETQTQDQSGDKISLLESLTSDTDLVYENIQIFSGLANETTVDEIISATKKSYKGKVLNVNKITIDGKEAKKMSLENGMIKSETCVFRHGKYIYTFTINVESKAYDTYKNDIDKFFNSLKLKEIVYKSPQADTKWQQYDCVGISLSYPDYYVIEDSTTFSSYSSGPDDYINEMFVIEPFETSEIKNDKIKYDADKNLQKKHKSFEDYIADSALKQYKVTSKKDVNINGVKWINAKGKFFSADDGGKIEQEMYFLITEKQSILILFCKENGNKLKKMYEEDFEKILKSIKIK